MSEDQQIITEELADRFKWPEYLVFSAMLAVSAGIGIFYGCFGGKQKTTNEFLMANRSMSVFPMAMSLIASFMSAITLLGTPVEMYQFGTQYWLIGFSYFFVMASASYLYLPVFFGLQVTSAYEYLELRFSKSLRVLGSFIFTLQMSIYMAIVVYAPALALSQVTGINVYVAVVAIFFVCIFYTALGGMKAVMWTDTFQVIVMFGAMLLVIVKGTIDVGGPNLIWQKALEGNRIEFFNFNPDPRERHTVWGLLIGGYFTWVTIYGTNQAQVQRYLTVPTIKQAQRAIWINCFGLFGLLSMCCFAGLVIYATYESCFPVYAQRVKTPDQLFPLFVMDTLGTIPGLPGLFVAGIFSGALSTVSSGLNSLATISLEDFVKRLFCPDISDSRATLVSKMLSVVFGLVSFGLVFVAEQLGGVLQAALSIFGMIGGPLLGVFTLGMFFPWANAWILAIYSFIQALLVAMGLIYYNLKGALVGTLSSLAFMMWLGFGANVAIANRELVIPKLYFNIAGCSPNDTLIIPEYNQGLEGGLIEFYRISYMWYSLIGCTIVIVIGLIVSALTSNLRSNSEKLNPALISPPILSIFHKLAPNWPSCRVGFTFEDQKTHENGRKKSVDHRQVSGIDNPAFVNLQNNNEGKLGSRSHEVHLNMRQKTETRF